MTTLVDKHFLDLVDKLVDKWLTKIRKATVVKAYSVNHLVDNLVIKICQPTPPMGVVDS